MIGARQSGPRVRLRLASRRPGPGRADAQRHEGFARAIAGRYGQWRSASGIELAYRRLRALVMLVRREAAGPVCWAPRLTLVLPAARAVTTGAPAGRDDQKTPEAAAGSSASGREALMTRVVRWQTRIETMPPPAVVPPQSAIASPLSAPASIPVSPTSAVVQRRAAQPSWPRPATSPSSATPVALRSPAARRAPVEAAQSASLERPSPVREAAPAPAVLSRVEIERVTERVMTAIDRRLTAQRERQGRGF